MSPVHPLFFVAALVIAYLTTGILSRFVPAPAAHGRATSIDGLRGYLAFSVFIHHAAIWYFYLRGGEWQAPPTALYNQLGQGSVALFFMITSFLFFSKILDSDQKPIDWGQLYISRLCRIAPLYLVVVALLFCLVGFLTNGILYDTPGQLLKQATHWLLFTTYAAPDLNGFPHTTLILAGVTWSLPYEWFFYLCLPVIAWSQRRKAPTGIHRLGIFALLLFIAWKPQWQHVLAFGGGMLAAKLRSAPVLCKFAQSGPGSYLAATALVLSFGLCESIRHPAALPLLTLAFTLIANGCDLFGVLRNPVSRLLGEFAYSIYLLHGLLLFSCFTLIIGNDAAAEFSVPEHWLTVLALIPGVILFSYVSFRLIELPGMRLAKPVLQRLRRWRSSVEEAV